jgi:hypothetical protein
MCAVLSLSGNSIAAVLQSQSWSDEPRCDCSSKQACGNYKGDQPCSLRFQRLDGQDRNYAESEQHGGDHGEHDSRDIDAARLEECHDRTPFCRINEFGG